MPDPDDTPYNRGFIYLTSSAVLYDDAVQSVLILNVGIGDPLGEEPVPHVQVPMSFEEAQTFALMFDHAVDQTFGAPPPPPAPYDQDADDA